MTVASKTASLTKAINDTVKELQVTQASLDGQVTTAEGYATTAATHQTTAEGYRDTTATHAATVATDLATVDTNVTYSGIAAIAASKVETAVDVFVYDTSLDSDGGAWRKRCQHTSWYNETLNTATRGSRREFPAVAVIVAELSKVTIYDGDDPALPMWMVFNANRNGTAAYGDATYPISTIVALNGEIAQGASGSVGGGLAHISFLKDESFIRVSNTSRYFRKELSKRNSTSTLLEAGAVEAIVNRGVNDVAMTVLPDAPIDPATGLPVPTIVVGTDGGTTVIDHNGNALSDTTFNWNSVVNTVLVDGETALAIASGSHLFVADIRDGQFGGFSGYSPTQQLSQSYGGTSWLSNINGKKNSFVDNVFHLGHNAGLVSYSGLKQGATRDWKKVSVRYVDQKFATGWHPYDTRCSVLTSTDASSLVGATPLEEGFDYADTNSLIAAGWVLGGDAIASEVTVSNSEMTVSNADSSDNNFVYKLFDTVAGANYKVTITSTQTSTQARMRIRDGVNANMNFAWSAHLAATNALTGTYSVSFTAISATTAVQLGASNGTGDATFQDIKIEAAEKDYSPKSQDLIVKGTITRSPVATGAELVGYSGFSYTNFLEQPYNSALDFGTGDFCYMGWLSDFDNWRTVLWRGTETATSFVIDPVATTGDARINLGGTPFITPCQHWTNDWRHMVVLRKDGVVSIYVNAVLQSSFSAANNSLTLTDATLRFGEQSATSGAGIYSQGQLALWRISATAPTADQIKKIYEDERKLFQPGAQCTLYGTSDAVTALAHDPKTNLLHVGTSAGRSTFDGLVRVDNTTNPVGTAISAVNGLIVEE